MKLLGKVCSGKGDFAQWIGRLSDHYKRKTGLVLLPGTLNVRLEDPYHSKTFQPQRCGLISIIVALISHHRRPELATADPA